MYLCMLADPLAHDSGTTATGRGSRLWASVPRLWHSMSESVHSCGRCCPRSRSGTRGLPPLPRSGGRSPGCGRLSPGCGAAAPVSRDRCAWLRFGFEGFLEGALYPRQPRMWPWMAPWCSNCLAASEPLCVAGDGFSLWKRGLWWSEIAEPTGISPASGLNVGRKTCYRWSSATCPQRTYLSVRRSFVRMVSLPQCLVAYVGLCVHLS